jgi:tartrate dehydrogenase/decarboxylase/D-malate dehydrogenase
MMTHRIAVIPGDGIGQEVIPAGIRVLDAAARRFQFGLEWTMFPWGSGYYRQHGEMMPSDALVTLRGFDAIYLGAIGDPEIPDYITLNRLLLPLRRGFDQYACVRPAKRYAGVRSPLESQPAIDLVVVRENTEGEYSDVGGQVHTDRPQAVAVQTAVFTRHGTERVIRYAFDLARGRRKHLTSVTKSNALGHSMTFWDAVFTEVAAEYPDVETLSLLVDAAAMDLVRRPQMFDVMVASNLFGDILTDVSAAVAGSVGLAPSANLNPNRTAPSMFEPVHGSAPDIAGRGIANPSATVLAGGMMLDFLGLSEAGQAVEQAVAAMLARGTARAPDLGGTAGTEAVTTAIVAELLR